MAKTPVKKTDSPEEVAAPPKGTPLMTFLMILTSTFTLALVGMLFATGAAQRSALPRIREMVAHAPLIGKRAEPEAQPAAAPADTLAAPPVRWSAAVDSIAILEQQLATALAEIASVRNPRTPPNAAGVTGGASGPPDAASFSATDADSGAMRDLTRLVKVLDAMKPAEAARILDSAPDELAIEAIRRLKERQAGKVLAALAPAKAMTVGQALGRAAELPE